MFFLPLVLSRLHIVLVQLLLNYTFCRFPPTFPHPFMIAKSILCGIGTSQTGIIYIIHPSSHRTTAHPPRACARCLLLASTGLGARVYRHSIHQRPNNKQNTTNEFPINQSQLWGKSIYRSYTESANTYFMHFSAECSFRVLHCSASRFAFPTSRTKLRVFGGKERESVSVRLYINNKKGRISPSHVSHFCVSGF